MKKLNPDKYDYLWSDYDVNFIFVSCYLFKEFRKEDIVLIYNHQNKELKFFLSNAYRKKLSGYGVRFYSKIFPYWKNKITKNASLGKRLIDETKQQNISSMDNNKIKENILTRAALFQSLGGNYFHTEFFFLDKIEQMIEEKPKKCRKIIENIKQMGKIKFEARKVLNEFYNYNCVFRPYIDELCSRLKRQDLQWLSFREIVSLIDGRHVPASDRGEIDWILRKHNNWKIIRGAEAEKIIQNFNAHFFKKHKKMFKGTIANKGVYEGRVKIIRTIFSDNVSKEIRKFEKGDILVAATTGPEIMSICQKAGAIITDEGGITSHAAIVSRELSIPCIVGTKIAAKTLKDGDIVRVDANIGMVRKISQKQPKSI